MGVKRAGAVPIVSYQADHSFREGVCQGVTPTKMASKYHIFLQRVQAPDRRFFVMKILGRGDACIAYTIKPTSYFLWLYQGNSVLVAENPVPAQGNHGGLPLQNNQLFPLRSFSF